MKTLKNDTRYIIKRVLIGVLIAIVLFNARKCGVYALENDYYFWGSNASGVNVSTQLSVCTSTLNSCYTEIDTIDYNGSTLHFYLQNRYKGTYNTSNIWFYEYNNELYFFGFFANQNTLSNYDYDHINIEKNTTYNYSTAPPNFRLMKNDSIVANIGSIDNAVSYLKNYFYKIDFSVIDKSASFLSAFTSNSNSSGGLLMNHILEDGSFINTNSNVPLYYNNINITAPSFPPTGYSELDLTGYQGVIFVPKNYSTMNYNQLYNLDFNYYYKGRVRDGYFLLNNSNQYYYDTDILISDDDYTERNGFYTLAKVQTNEGITTTTTIEYSAFVVYNSSPTGDWQGDILPPYGESYVVYDSTLYDYYLVEDFSTFNQTICFYDFENNQICINVKSLPTLNDILDEANSSTTNQDIPQQKINYILEFLKLPIRSLRRVAEGTCEAISLPIPIIGGTIQLNCLSSLFQNVLGASFDFFRLIINGLLLYRITLHNIKVFKDVLDPSNTGIEVVNL